MHHRDIRIVALPDHPTAAGHHNHKARIGRRHACRCGNKSQGRQLDIPSTAAHRRVTIRATPASRRCAENSSHLHPRYGFVRRLPNYHWRFHDHRYWRSSGNWRAAPATACPNDSWHNANDNPPALGFHRRGKYARQISHRHHSRHGHIHRYNRPCAGQDQCRHARRHGHKR